MSGSTVDGSAGTGAAGAGGEQGCIRTDAGDCISKGDHVCCSVLLVMHFLVQYDPLCKITLSPAQGTPACWPMFHETACNMVSEYTDCYMRALGEETELVVFYPDVSKPEDLGPGWSECNKQLLEAPDCT